MIYIDKDVSEVRLDGVNIPVFQKPEQEKTVSPSTVVREVYPDNGYSMSKVSVDAVTAEIDSNIQPENIKQDVEILGVVGTMVEPQYNVQSLDKEDGTQKLAILDVGGGYNVYSVFKADGTQKLVINDSSVQIEDMLQERIDENNDASYLFYKYSGDDLSFIERLDTSKVTTMYYTFGSCSHITSIPYLDTSNVTTMQQMFNGCSSLTTIPDLNTSEVTSMSEMFSSCKNLTTMSELNVGNVTSMYSMFQGCTNLTTVLLTNTSNVTNMYAMFISCTNLTDVSILDMVKASNTSGMFGNCYKLQNLTLKNVKISLSLAQSNLLTQDSLLNTIKELWDLTGSTSQTLTLHADSKAILDGIYIKLIEITDEMRAEDEYIDNKKPFEIVTAETEGAMLIADYITLKNWTLV